MYLPVRKSQPKIPLMNNDKAVNVHCKKFLLVSVLFIVSIQVFGQSWDYPDVLTKSIQFYEAQICGEQPNWSRANSWRRACHLDDGAYLGVDLTGGWHDAGDHVKFNYPMAQAITTLSWSYLNYNDQFEASQNKQNLLNNLRLIGDFIIKCHPSPNVFYAQIASGDEDHSNWNSPEDDTYFRQVYEINPSSPGTDMASSMAAAFASLSMVFSNEDPQYSSELLQHAEDLYDFGDTYRGLYTDQIDDGAFYDSNDYRDDLIWGALWLYKATNEQNYLNKAEANFEDIRYNNNWFPNWGDHSYASFLLLSEITGKQIYLDKTESWLENEIDNAPRTPGGLYFRNSFLSTNSAAALAYAAFYFAELRGDSYEKYNKFKDFAQSQYDYMLGDNPRNSSYVVGYGNNFPTRTHHQAAHQPTCNPCSLAIPIEDTNELTGALIGGPDSNDDFENSRGNYMESEMAVSNQSYFVGLAAQMFKENGGTVTIPANDLITNVSAPNSVTQGETIDVTIDYEASQNRDILVVFELASDPYTSYVQQIRQVTAGSGTLNVPISVPLSTPVATNAYQFQVILAPTGGGWPERLDNEGIANVDVTEVVFANDVIDNVTAPNSVTQGETVNITIDYEASQNRDILVLFELATNPYTSYVQEIIQVTAGSGTLNVPISVPLSTPAAADAYQFQVILAPTGGGWPERLDNQGVANVDVIEVVPTNDLINSVSASDSVTQGETIDVTIDYEASQNRDILVLFELASDPYTSYVQEIIQVTAGSGTLNVPISVPLSTPAAINAYQFQVILAPTGGGWPERLDNQGIANVDVIEALPANDLVTNVSAPSSVTQGETIDVTIAYEATGNRDIVVVFQLNSNPYTSYLVLRQQVGAGVGSFSIPSEIPLSTPVGIGAYQFQAFIAPIGGFWSDRFSDLPSGSIDVLGGSTNCNIVVRAMGSTGEERMQLEVGGQVLETWTLTTQFANYAVNTVLDSDNVKVRFINDGIGSNGDRNIRVDGITVNNSFGVESENVLRDGCGNSEWLWCNGYFDYGDISCSGINQSAARGETFEDINEFEFNMYPNPTIANRVNLIVPNEGSVKVFDLLGRLVYEKETASGLNQLSFDKLHSGMYLVKVSGMAPEETITKKLIIR